MTDKPGDAAKTIGQAIDEIIRALMPLDDDSRKTAIRASCDHLKIPFGPSQPHLSNRGADSSSLRSTGSTIISDIKALKACAPLSEVAPRQRSDSVSRLTSINMKCIYLTQRTFKGIYLVGEVANWMVHLLYPGSAKPFAP
jgi:hypothetical protein